MNNPIRHIAILQANPDKKALEPRYPNDGVKYQTFFSVVFPEAQFDIYRVFENQFPPDINHYDLYFITGSLYAAYDDFPWIERLKNTIVEIQKKDKYLIGLCFGHQIIAEALGGKVERSCYDWQLGIKSIKFHQVAWMKPEKTPLKLIHIHQDQVVKLPPNAQILSTDKQCDFEAYQIGERILCCQGHPEFSNDYVENLLPIIQKRFSKPCYQLAMNSLRESNDGVIFAQWVKVFTEGYFY